MLSRRALKVDELPFNTSGTRLAKPSCAELGSAGGNGPENLPVVGSSVGTVLPVSAAPARSSTPPTDELDAARLPGDRPGVTAFETRADSRLEGPDAAELTSNAVTA